MSSPGYYDPSFTPNYEWAAMYRGHGIQVIPSWMPDEVPKGSSYKRPKLSEWRTFQEELVADNVFARWYDAMTGEYRTKGNMGALTGRASGNLLVIDLDLYKLDKPAGVWWHQLIEAENNGIEPQTVRQKTGGGGVQLFFRCPPGYRVPTNKTGIGVDIRGQGGFVVLPPSLHESGNFYEWLPGCSPDETPIAMAPQWLLDAVEALVAEHGGHQSGGERTATPAADIDDFGNVLDGREKVMRDTVWWHVLGWYRESPIQPTIKMWEVRCLAAYEDYERRVTSRIPGIPKREGLEQENPSRGVTAFKSKWRATMRRWGSDAMKEAAARPNPRGSNSGQSNPQPEPKIDPETGQPLPLLLTAEQFLRGFVPPDYLVDGVIQKSYLYSLTARTGHGKTAVAMLLASCIARGVPFHGHPVAPGKVLFLAGENPQDVRARYKVLADSEQFDPKTVPFHFVDGVIDIAASLPKVREEAAKIGNLVLVIVDTATAYFRGDDSNSNAQQGLFAQLLRQLISLPGAPAVVVNCHPVKNAAQDNLIPLGGSNFINEVDGNLTLWADDKTCALNHHPAKWRGAPFEAMEFELRTTVSDTVKDTKGRHMPSVVAVPITEQGAERRGAVAEADEDMVLGLIHTHKTASIAEIATKAGFVLPDGRPYRSKVQRVMERLKASKLIYKYRGSKYRLTKKGCKVAGVRWEKDDNDD